MHRINLLLFFIGLSIYSNAQFLKTKADAIVNERGEKIILRGMGLGGWMLQEGYMFRLSFLGQQYRIKEKIAGVLRRGQEMFVDILNQGIKNGEFSDMLDPVVFAFKAVAAVEGGVVMCRSMNTSKPMQGLIKSLKAELESYAL